MGRFASWDVRPHHSFDLHECDGERVTVRTAGLRWACEDAVVIDPSEDAFGAALLDYLDGRDVPGLVLEVAGGGAGPAMHPEWFFRRFERWEWWDRELVPPSTSVWRPRMRRGSTRAWPGWATSPGRRL